MNRRLFLCAIGGILFALAAVNLTPGDEPHRQTPGRCTPYVLDRPAFANDLATAKDEGARLHVLGRRWEAVTRAVAYCNAAAGEMPFSQSMMYWHSGYVGGAKTESKGNLKEPVEADKEAVVIVRGDCMADITLKGNGFIHVYGDLHAMIRTIGNVQCEIVIGGEIRPTAKIEVEGITRVFVGGDVKGNVVSRGSLFLWVDGDYDAALETGTPITNLHVMGDFKGSMKPFTQAALAFVDVRGFMASDKVKAVAEQHYTQFQASVGFSDQPPGLYPTPRAEPNMAHWVVHAQGKPDQSAEATEPTHPAQTDPRLSRPKKAND